MGFVLTEVLNGLAYASTLFIMAAGLTLIFGVTRIVNFAHGSFFMFGALLGAHLLSHWLPAWGESAWGYLGAMALATLASGALGALTYTLLLRRMTKAPELYQLVATFGLTLFASDLMRWGFGPNEVFAPRFPGLKGAFELPNGDFFPQYTALTIALGPLVWLGLHGLLTRTRWGRRVRAATADSTMLGALGVNPGPLVLGAVTLGCALAGLAGALQLPREPAHLQMDTQVVVETFVVVVTGGLGSITGAFLAAVLIGLIHSFGVSLFPQATLVLVFFTMAVILTLKPQGLMGQVQGAGPREVAEPFRGLKMSQPAFAVLLVACCLAAGLVAGVSEYAASLVADALILLIFGLSLQAMMALGGLASFGHAAYFGLGAYGAALAHLHWGAGLGAALLCGSALAGLVAAAFGAAVIRSGGVYLAMLSLALAQMVWAGASQWVALTGGDNGLIGLDWVGPQQRRGFFVLLLCTAMLTIAGLRALATSRFGLTLQAARDAPERAAASGLSVAGVRYRVFVGSSVLAGLAGGLFAAHKGAVFPSVASVAMSVDALLVVLLGGVHQLWGAVLGSVVLTGLSAELGREFAYWRGALGVAVMLMMVAAPSGLLGLGGRLRAWVAARRAPRAAGVGHA